MFGLLDIFGPLWGEPWYGKNAGLMEGLPTGLRDIELTGSRFLSVPRPVAAQRHPRAAINLFDKPQRACRGQDQTQRVGPYDALAFTTLLLAQTREGVGVTDGNFHRPAVTILREDVLRAQGEIGREKRLDRWGWFAVARTFGAALALTPYDHNPQESPRQHRVPQATPGLDLGARFARMWLPPLSGLRQGFGRANQVAFFARGATTLGSGGRWQLVELGADRETPHDMGRLGQLPDIVLGGIATVRQAPDGASG